MGLFTNTSDKETRQYNDELVASSLNDRLNESYQSVGNSIFSMWKDAVNHVENPLTSLWENASGGVGDLLAGLGLPGGFGHPARILRLLEDDFKQEGTTGLYGYKMPSDKQFMNCQQLDGLSVWDSRGWWRCLFPERVVGSNNLDYDQMRDVLTREKVEQDKKHSLGLFFTEYSSYLTWRADIIRLAESRRNSLLAAKAERHGEHDNTPMTPEDLMDRATGRNVVGTSEYVTYNTTPEGLEKVKEVKTFFDDGTVRLRSEKQRTDPDGRSHVDAFEKLLDDHDNAKDGWFWRK
ncbi:LAME_0F18734g1_1 [Lachancea meyersii CBS 8951]|uniref:LAME_0F18734g1_1 n=1 Tax=Lachancea meyersii CBS 8951 TaxID=1266667 RepID=A0A1G4K0W9_9SACH|nr:LAME_0F18734g1_1 [Lachancea meyersii CBS 8951]